MQNSRRPFGILCAAVLTVSAIAWCAPVNCPWLAVALDLDGSLADSVWRGLAPLGTFRLANGQPAGEATEVRACHDSETLFIICTCREEDVSVVRAHAGGRDADLGADDRVELHLATNGSRYLFVASAGGGLWDAHVEGSNLQQIDPTWNSAARTAVKVFKHGWGVEVAIPLAGLGAVAEAGTKMRLNAVRHRRHATEVSRLLPEGQWVTLTLAKAAAVVEPIADVRPRAGIRYSAADIRRARENARRFDWAKSAAGRTVKSAESYLAKPTDHWLSFMPPEGATFAYGFAGCPRCRSNWKRFGSGMCSFDRPGKVVCPKCKTVFPPADPNSPWFDSGPGVEVEGHMYYFTGIWHAWVINQYKAMLAAFSQAYALTGDERYAERAALIFDGMATLAPSTVGPIDNMRPNQEKVGIFHYYTQQLTENLRSYLLYYDLLYHSSAMAKSSPTNPTGFGREADTTIRRNVEKNLFLDTWDVEMNTRNGRLPSLHNHTSATVRAMMGVGLVCGEPDLIRWGIEAAYKFIYNTADPEGQYYETSGAGYNECGRQCNASFADMLWNYDPAHYDDPGRFPQPKDYPYEIKLFRHPRMQLHLDRALYEMDCVGFRPRYGDAGATSRVLTDTIGEWGRLRLRWAFTLYRSAETEERRCTYYRKMQIASRRQNPETQLGSDGLFWFGPLDDPPELDPVADASLVRSSLWGQRATAILRQGEGDDRLALLMLGGTIFPHGNDDTLHIALYSQRQMLTHDVAYDLYGRPIHMGWACRSIAHTTVTVDERGGPPLYRGGPNATVTGFGDYPSISYVAMATGPRCWENQPAVRRYDRACALVKLPGTSGYVVDLFEVAGGKQHDYSFHGQVTSKGEGFSLEGAKLEPVPNVWTLAGLSGHADATFDAPGRSWGERVLPGNRIRKLGISGEEVGYFNWYPPPGNGYGFLYDVKAAPLRDRVVADWTTEAAKDIHLRMTLFPGEASTIITARGPDLTGTSVIPFAIARRNGDDLTSSFLAAFEGYTGTPQVQALTLAPEHDGMRGLTIESAGGVIDHVWLDTHGRLAFVRTVDGVVVQLSLCQVEAVEFGGLRLALASPVLTSAVTSVDYDGHAFRTDLALACPAALQGRTLFVSSNDYVCNSGYRVKTCDDQGRFGFGLVGFGLSMGEFSRLGKDGVVESKTPLTLGFASGQPRTTGLLDGKLARTANGNHAALVTRVQDRTHVRFELEGATIAQGDRFIIYDVKAGDTVSVPMSATLRRMDSGEWELDATCEVTVRLPGGEVAYENETGQWMFANKGPAGATVPAVADTRRLRTAAIGRR